MKIALVAPLVESIPPKRYGGTERVIEWLLHELVRRGHTITLFATADSTPPAGVRLIPCADTALRHTKTPEVTAHTIAMLDQVRDMADEFDVIHCHLGIGEQFLLPKKVRSKMITTVHWRLDGEGTQRLLEYIENDPLVAISKSQQSYLADANWAGVIYHGLPKDLYHLEEEPEEYVAFLGRFSPEKGFVEACEIARRANIKLKIAAKIETADQEYFDQEARPRLGVSMVEYIGEVNEEQKQKFLGKAKAVLFPIRWPEPFGLVMIEAMACGTPVIAFNEGSVSEVLEHGKTGFILTPDAREVGYTLSDAADLLRHQVETIDRKAIRAEFEKRFTADRMTSEYEELYQHIAASASALKEEKVISQVS